MVTCTVIIDSRKSKTDDRKNRNSTAATLKLIKITERDTYMKQSYTYFTWEGVGWSGIFNKDKGDDICI